MIVLRFLVRELQRPPPRALAEMLLLEKKVKDVGVLNVRVERTQLKREVCSQCVVSVLLLWRLYNTESPLHLYSVTTFVLVRAIVSPLRHFGQCASPLQDTVYTHARAYSHLHAI